MAKNKSSKKRSKVETTMHEFKIGDLHQGSKKGPIVTNKDQAIAIALHQSKKKKKK